jgi:alanyl-tRNA synthetase
MMLDEREELSQISDLLRNPKDINKGLQQLIDEKSQLEGQLQQLLHEKGQQVKQELIAQAKDINGVNFIAQRIAIPNAEVVKNIAFELRNQFNNLLLVLGHESNGKPMITVALSDEVVKTKGLNAGQMVRQLAQHIKGGGGGQPFYATAGGTDINGLEIALKEAEAFLN